MATIGPINTGFFNYSQGNYITRIDYDVNSNAIYQGWAPPGSLASDSVWRIAQNTYDGSNRFTNSGFPNGSPSFTFVWNDRATYTYS